MKKYPKTFKLKDGESVLIRPMEKNDFEQLVQFFQALHEEDRAFLRINVQSRDEIQRRFENLSRETCYCLIGIIKDHIIAEASLFRDAFGWKRKLGDIRVVVAREFQRKGLGKILTREIFLYALTTDMLKVQAEIMENQHGARKAFEHMGFRPETVLKDHVTDIYGNRHNLVVMSLDIEELWRIMEDFIPDRLFVV